MFFFILSFLIHKCNSVSFDISELLEDALYVDSNLPKFLKLHHYKGFTANISFPKDSLIIFDHWEDTNVSFFGRKLRTNEIKYEKLGPYSQNSELRGVYYPGFNFSMEINSTAFSDTIFSFSLFIISEDVNEIYLSTESISKTLKQNGKMVIISPTTQKKKITINSKNIYSMLQRNYTDHALKDKFSNEFEAFDICEFQFFDDSGEPEISFEQEFLESNSDPNPYDIEGFLDPTAYPLLFSDKHVSVRTAMLDITIVWTVLVLAVSVGAFVWILRKIA